MNSVAPYSLSIIPSFLVLTLCLYIIYKGRLEWGIGIYLSMGMVGEGTILVFSIAQFYVLIATILGASFSYFLNKKRGKILPKHDQWIVLWVILWWAYELVLLIFGGSPYRSILLMSLIPRIIVPIPIILLFANNLKKIRGFALAYILTTILSGLKIYFFIYGISLSDFFSDPSLRSLGIFFYTGKNYHWFSYPFAISIIFLFSLLAERKTKHIKAFLIFCTILCAYFILIAGSRQTIFGLLVVLIIQLQWILKHEKRNLAYKVVFYFLVFLFIGYGIYAFSYVADLIIRQNESGLGDALNIVNSRGTAWSDGIQAFLQNPLFGTAFNMYGSHNLFIGTLAEQGIIGFVFLIVYLIFISKQSVGLLQNRNKFILWRIAFLSIIIFGLIHSMASGSAVSVWHLYWPVPFMWHLKYQ